MPEECEACPSSGDGCQPRNWKALIIRLNGIADSGNEGTRLIDPILRAAAGCLAAAGGCPRQASLLLFPLLCCCRGLLEYLSFTREQMDVDRVIEELFRVDGHA